MERARVVVIGGGVWGCGTLYQLAGLGLTDCLLVERALAAGLQAKDVPPGQGALRTARARLGEVFPPFRDATVVQARAGFPGFTPDGEHLLGALDRPRGLVLAAGCSATGIMDGMAGRLAAEVAVGQPPFLDVAAMHPARVGRRYGTQTALRAACEAVYRNYYALQGGRV